MAYLVQFLNWLGFACESWPVWGTLLLTLALLVGTVLLVLVSMILVSRAARAAWQAKAETSQAKSRAFNDALTASRLGHERSKAEATQAADLAKIRQESQAVIEGPQREIVALKKGLEDQHRLVGERDASLAMLKQERDRILEQLKQIEGKLEVANNAKATLIGDADDHRIERQQQQAELVAVRQQLGQAQAEIGRLDASLKAMIARVMAIA